MFDLPTLQSRHVAVDARRRAIAEVGAIRWDRRMLAHAEALGQTAIAARILQRLVAAGAVVDTAALADATARRARLNGWPPAKLGGDDKGDALPFLRRSLFDIGPGVARA